MTFGTQKELDVFFGRIENARNTRHYLNQVDGILAYHAMMDGCIHYLMCKKREGLIRYVDSTVYDSFELVKCNSIPAFNMRTMNFIFHLDFSQFAFWLKGYGLPCRTVVVIQFHQEQFMVDFQV